MDRMREKAGEEDREEGRKIQRERERERGLTLLH